MDALSLTFDRDGGAKSTGVSVASTLLTTGITANWDVQIGAELFLSQKYEAGGFSERHSGVGDIFVRTKWRVWSNPEGGDALAIMPFVKIPTNTGGVGNKSLEGGLILPWTITLPAALSLATMVELDCVRNAGHNGYASAWFGTAALSRQVTKTVGLYVEGAAGKSAGGAPWECSLGGGVTWAVTEQFSWDFAVYRGISREAVDWNPVVRLNWGF